MSSLSEYVDGALDYLDQLAEALDAHEFEAAQDMLPPLAWAIEEIGRVAEDDSGETTEGSGDA